MDKEKTLRKLKQEIAEVREKFGVEFAEVVRCKDCEFFGREISHGKHDCKQYEMPYCMENDFCSYGKRRTNDV